MSLTSHPHHRLIRVANVGLVIIAAVTLVGCSTEPANTTRAASTAQATKTTAGSGTDALGETPPASAVTPHGQTNSQAPTSTAAPVHCDAVSGQRAIPGGIALVRSPAVDHRRAAVMMLHGFTATPQAEETVSGWTDLMAGTDVAVVYPQGNPTPSEGFGWTTGTDRFSTSGTDDVARIASMLAWLVDDNCVDPNQILIAGESNGAAMALTLACSGRAGITPKLYALAIPAVDENVTSRCEGAASFPVLVFAGRQDATVRFDGNPSRPDAPTAPMVWFSQIASTTQQCLAGSDARRGVPGGSVTTLSGCTATTAFFAIDQGHHTWPGGPTGAGVLNPGTFPAGPLAWCAAGIDATPKPVGDCATMLTRYGLSD